MRKFSLYYMMTEPKDHLYVSPWVKMIELRSRTIICLSDYENENESYQEGDTSNWFNL